MVPLANCCCQFCLPADSCWSSCESPCGHATAATAATALHAVSLDCRRPQFHPPVTSGWPSSNSARGCAGGLTRATAHLATALPGTALPQDCHAAQQLWLQHRMFVTIMSGLVLTPATAKVPVPGWHSRAARGHSRLSLLAAISYFFETPFLAPATAPPVPSSAFLPAPPHC